MQNQIEKWSCQKEGWIKVNFDGAWLDDTGGVGVIVQSSDGKSQLVAGRRIGARSVDEVELIEVWTTVSMVLEHFSSQNVIVVEGARNLLSMASKGEVGDPKFIIIEGYLGPTCIATTGMGGYT